MASGGKGNCSYDVIMIVNGLEESVIISVMGVQILIIVFYYRYNASRLYKGKK